MKPFETVLASWLLAGWLDLLSPRRFPPASQTLFLALWPASPAVVVSTADVCVQEERRRWESTRAWALTEWRAVSAEAWRAVSAEAARRQVLWEAEKAIEDGKEEKRSAEDACDWTPAEQAEALREAAAVLEAEAAERARWKSFAEGWFADAEAAILREPWILTQEF